MHETKFRAGAAALITLLIVFVGGAVFIWPSLATKSLFAAGFLNRDKNNSENAAQTSNIDKKSAGPTQLLTNKVKVTKANPKRVVLSAAAQSVGIFVSDAPDNPESIAHLNQVANLGFNVVFNYSSFDGSPAQVNAYLNRAQFLGVKVIFSLKDLYNQLPEGAAVAASYPEYGQTNDEIAANVVRNFANHPATWGFATTDEAPELPSDLPAWKTTLVDRYHLIKSLTTKPVMQVLIGYSADTAAQRRAFLSALRPSTDTFALDYYPIPFDSIDLIGDFAADMASQVSNGWSIIQDFSWANYPETAVGLGYDLGTARAPSNLEMYNMGALAINNGAKNLLFYSFFDIKTAAQKQAIKAAVHRLKAGI